MRSNTSRQQSKALYRWRVRRRGKSGKHRKVVKRKWWVLAKPLFPARKQEAVTQGENNGNRPPYAENLGRR